MKNYESTVQLNPRHVRAARALLAWSQQDLAKAAKIATSTLADFERGSRTPTVNNVQAIRSALEASGISFLPNGAITGGTAPIINRNTESGVPERWINANDLGHWATLIDSHTNLPTLISQLIRAEHGNRVLQLDFPADSGVHHSGWDGKTDVKEGSRYVPEGPAGWELSAQRNNIAQKIKRDYAKRTNEPAPLDPASSSCIFVTLHHWREKDAWAQEKTATGPWREVRVYDANDLVHWIEQNPAVGLWLATRLGKWPEGTRELDEVWKEWSLVTEPPLNEQLVLSDRDESAVEVLRWLRAEPSVLSLQATTSDEVVAFFHATLSELPKELALAYRAICLVVTTTSAARKLAYSQAPLILIFTEPNSGLGQILVKKGHFVLQAYGDQPPSQGNLRQLERPSREGIRLALESMGIAEPRAFNLARDSARNLSILRRLIARDAGQRADWAEKPLPSALLAAMLAGGWDDNNEADQASLSELAGAPYDQVIASLTLYADQLNSPLQVVGSNWRISSPNDVWFQLAPYLTSININRFEAVAFAVLSSTDLRFEIAPHERRLADIRGIKPEYSNVLRRGIGQTLIFLALRSDQIKVPGAAKCADAVVNNVLANADRGRWWSLSQDFQLLAEASPEAFLSAVENSLEQKDPPILTLFDHDENSFLGTEYLSDLLRAMQSLAWSPKWLSRVTFILARLDTLDPKPPPYGDRTANCLREIYLLWKPQTCATLDQRLRVIDQLRKKNPDAAWKLMLGMLPSEHDSLTPSSKPRWRDFSVDEVEPITWSLIRRGAEAVSQRLLQDVKDCARHWISLIDRIRDFAIEPEVLLNAMEQTEPNIAARSDRDQLWHKIRSVLHQNRRIPDAQARLPDAVLDRLTTLYDRFAPADALEQIVWLFNDNAQLPNPPTDGWEANQRAVYAAQIEAVKTIFAEQGITGVLALARRVKSAGYLGKTLYDGGLELPAVEILIESTVQSNETHEQDVAHGLINSAFHDRGEAWGAALIAKARALVWSEAALLNILLALPFARWTWEQARNISSEVENAYWRRTPAPGISNNSNNNSDDTAYAIRHLIEVGRARYSLHLTYNSTKLNLPTDLLVETLEKAAIQPFKDDSDNNQFGMLQFYVVETLCLLDERKDVTLNQLARLEGQYWQFLEYSRRPPKILLRVICEQASLFVKLLIAVFRPSEESGFVDPQPLPDPEEARWLTPQADHLLSLLNQVPGTRQDGTIDEEVLEAWIKEVRSLAKSVGRAEIADAKIGVLLSASPIGVDGLWPAEPVRAMLDLFHSKHMLSGFQVGKINRRGITKRLLGEGGEQERELVEHYRHCAELMAIEYPHTAKALNSLASNYEQEAQRYDDDVERFDWDS